MNAHYVLRRLLQVAPVVAGIVTLTFVLVHLAPGDPIDVLAAEGGSPAYLAGLRAEYGLDRSLLEQFLSYAGKILRADFGDSIIQGRPVSTLIGSRLRPTLLLTTSALVIATLGALFLGQLAARRPFGLFDLTLSTATLVLYAMPAFWLAQIVVLTVALQTGWFPVQGFSDARGQYTGLAHVVDLAHHLVLPALVLAASEVALLARITRTGLLQEAGKGYARTARGKGLAEAQVVSQHALRNVALPIVTVVGSRVGFLLSGTVLVETVFAWPGLGTLLVDSARAQDYPVVLALVLLAAGSVVIANLMTDLLYAYVDPRVRLR